MKMSSSDKALVSGHRERLRNKFAGDASSLSDAEILELALGYVYVRRDNSLLARRLLSEKGSIAQVMRSSLAQLEQVEGCGAPVHRFFCIIKELNARSQSDDCHRPGPISLAEIAEMAKARLSSCNRERSGAKMIQ